MRIEKRKLWNWQITAWMIWQIAAFVLMIMYELYWIRYFKREKTMKDFYSSLMGIPVAGAALPVTACGLMQGGILQNLRRRIRKH